MISCFETCVHAVLHILVNKQTTMMQEEIYWMKGYAEELDDMKTCKHEYCHVQTLNQYSIQIKGDKYWAVAFKRRLQ